MTHRFLALKYTLITNNVHMIQSIYQNITFSHRCLELMKIKKVYIHKEKFIPK